MRGPAVGQSRLGRFIAHFDWPLFVVMIVILGIGLANLYAGTVRTPNSSKFDQQLLRVFVAMAAFFAMTLLDYRMLQRLVWLGLGLAILALIVVFVMKQIKGSQRWIELAGIRVQPAEPVKIAVILAIARIVEEREPGEFHVGEAFAKFVAVAVPIVLIALQPDLGSSALTMLVALSVAYLTASTLWPLVTGTLIGMALMPVLWDNLRTYQKQRIMCFLDPEHDTTGMCWNALQSIFAVGSGRISGKGYMEGTQSRMNWVPEYWTDFPFSGFAEEWGFLGAVVLLALFGFLIFWIVSTALQARDRFGCVICIGVAALLFWHVVINIAMEIGVAPVVGVPLPMISYGGSSLVAFAIALGLVSSVSLRRHGY